MSVTLVGRDAETAQVAAFLETLPRGPRILLITGEAGIGKTTLLGHCRDIAGKLGLTVLSCSPVEAEMPLAFAGLCDLFDHVPERLLDLLPGPQRRAARQAILRAEPSVGPVDQRTISMAALGLLRRLADVHPVILILDDLQWLDPPSARALSFALRRLRHEPVGLISTVRTGWPGRSEPLAPAWAGEDTVTRLEVGPLSLGAMREFLLVRTGLSPARPQLLRLHEASGGNPLLALELAARANDTIPPGLYSSADASTAMRQLVLDRASGLSPGARDILLVCSLVAGLPHHVICAAARDTTTAYVDLDEGIQAGLLVLAGQDALFAHPLMRSVVLETARSADRRAAHRRLASVVPGFDARARHLGLGAEAPEEAIAGTVEDAARVAAHRGACDSAADLAELAVALTPLKEPHRRRQRIALAARQRFEASDPARARALLEDIIDSTPAGSERAELMRCLARYRAFCGEPLAAWAEMLALALYQAAGGDPRLRGLILLDQAVVASNMGNFGEAARRGELALRAAERAGDPALQAQCCAGLAFAAFVLGEGLRQDLIGRARRGPAEPAALSMELRPNIAVGHVLHWAGDLSAAREIYEREYATALRAGVETGLPLVMWAMAENEVWAGDWRRARELVTDGWSRAQDSGSTVALGFMSAARGLLNACQGHVDDAFRDATLAVETAGALGIPLLAAIGAQPFGIAALSTGDARLAHERLAPLASALAGEMAEPALCRFLPAENEALIRLGRLDEARALLGPLQSRSARLERGWGIAVAQRCLGLLFGAAGDLARAQQAVEAALEVHRRLPSSLPFEEARSLLAAGEVHRRARHKHEALGLLRRAQAAFDGLGAPLWAARAGSEMDRIGVRTARPASGQALTVAEQRVAGLAADGRTNPEIATELFMGLRTVEAHLSRTYRKLGVRSRTELCRTLTVPRQPEPAKDQVPVKRARFTDSSRRT
jgi:DNA-binding CsgD family transcriptional regulator